MRKLLEERDISCVYSVTERKGESVYKITVYPKVDRPIVNDAYRYDLIPQWIKEAMSLQDVAYPDHVPNLGRRIGDTYWIDPISVTPSLIAVMHYAQTFAKKS